MRSPLPIIILASILIAFTSIFTLNGFAFSGDEYSYLFQAKILATGSLYAQPPPFQQAFQLHHVINDAKWHGRYTIGWPAILAISEIFKAAWLLKAMLGGATIMAVFTLANKLHGRRAAIFASAVLAASPFFIFNSASLYPHTASLLFSAVFAIFFFHSLGKQSLPSQIISGAALGAVFTIRPIDAAITGLPFAIYAAMTIRDPKKLAAKTWAILAAAAAVASIQLLVNYFFTKNPLTFTYQTYDPSEKFALRASALAHLLYRLGLLAIWMPFFALIFFAGKEKKNILLISMIAVNILVYLAFPFTGGDQFGPRYYFPSLISMAILAGSAFSKLKVSIPAAISAIIMVNMPGMAFLTLDIHQETLFRQQPFAEVESQGMANALVIMKSSQTQGCEWYTRNNPKLKGNVYACDVGEKNNQLISAFPGKTPYYYDLAKMGASKSLYSRIIRYS